ncbi:MAG TPA: hypothetical protein VD833_02035 [Vicinamibacterales bacterium]|nr:hypothetical protein [Vicinamibacterales bacterium]
MASNEKREQQEWSSDPDTVERRDREGASGGEQTGQESAGITNRPLDEEEGNQDAVPPRGERREGAHAGHGDRDRTGG